jgi:hypothetical protein
MGFIAGMMVLGVIFLGLYLAKKGPFCECSGDVDCNHPKCKDCCTQTTPPCKWYTVPLLWVHGPWQEQGKTLEDGSTLDTIEATKTWVLNKLGLTAVSACTQNVVIIWAEKQGNFLYGLGNPSQASPSTEWSSYLWASSEPKIETV